LPRCHDKERILMLADRGKESEERFGPSRSLRLIFLPGLCAGKKTVQLDLLPLTQHLNHGTQLRQYPLNQPSVRLVDFLRRHALIILATIIEIRLKAVV